MLLLSVRPGAPPTTLTSTGGRPRSRNALAGWPALPRARLSTVADVHSPCMDASRPNFRVCRAPRGPHTRPFAAYRPPWGKHHSAQIDAGGRPRRNPHNADERASARRSGDPRSALQAEQVAGGAAQPEGSNTTPAVTPPIPSNPVSVEPVLRSRGWLRRYMRSQSCLLQAELPGHPSRSWPERVGLPAGHRSTSRRK